MMSQHGLQSLYPMEELAVMGIWELLPHLYKIRVCMMKLSILFEFYHKWFCSEISVFKF